MLVEKLEGIDLNVKASEQESVASLSGRSETLDIR